MSQRASDQAIQVKPLAGHIGAEIHGADISKPLPDEAVAAIRAALLKWKVVFFRNQPLGHAEQIAFAARFGEVTYAHPHEDEPFDEHPEILAIDSRRYDRRYGRRFSYENRWHTDVTAAVNPPAASILRAHILPPYGGDTTWTNLVAAYEGLSAPLRALVDGLRAEHRFGLRFAPQDQDSPYLRKVRENPLISIHPVVRVHPETGERALFVSPGFTSHIVGLSPRESSAILDLLFEQISRPAYTVRFRWEPGSIAFWDNRATAHLGPQDLGHLDVDRVLYRVTLTGDIPVGVDGVRSEIVAGEPFGKRPPSKVKPARKDKAPEAEVQA
ncbi:TauD/TfdA dioxygenase family protein [Sorangium sp. So ce117]|uniref:TauD/TfdA dioxygenase family protein n=1 Tax=Sorangium sp. So ce117 TaxID=3133277 RepID=UPI003F629955